MNSLLGVFVVGGERNIFEECAGIHGCTLQVDDSDAFAQTRRQTLKTDRRPVIQLIHDERERLLQFKLCLLPEIAEIGGQKHGFAGHATVRQWQRIQSRNQE